MAVSPLQGDGTADNPVRDADELGDLSSGAPTSGESGGHHAQPFA